MRYRIATEDIEPNHWVAWILDLPACFSSAQTQADAVALVPERISAYYSWLLSHDSSLSVITEPIQVEVEIVETFHSFPSMQDPEYVVNAFFEDDRRVPNYWDVELALRLLQWTRRDLLAVLQSVTQEQLSEPIPGQVSGSIAGIIKHIAGAENWYFGQLDLALDRAQLPNDPLDMLKAVRANTRAQLVKLIGNERITQNCGEFWSARKVIRRTLWHERDHTQHIAHLLAYL
jgi:uncharacterized damage-inducible protein DinB/predicted RNase H-like HicB family nuclease